MLFSFSFYVDSPSCSSFFYSYSIPDFSCTFPCFSCSSSFLSFSREACVLGLLKLTSLVVVLLSYVTGGLVFPLGEVISSIFPSLGPTSPFLLGDSSILIGNSEGGFGFPYLILVLFLIFKYRGPCLGCLILGLTSVLNVSNMASTSCFVFPIERLV